MKRLIIVAVLPVLAAVSLAAGKDIKLDLEFVPQDAIGAPTATMQSGIAAHPVQITLTDGRSIEDAGIVGHGQTNKDESLPVRSTKSVEDFLEKVLLQTATELGIATSGSAPLVLEVKITRFLASERDQAVGSTYQSDAAVAYSLKTRDGKVLHKGSASGGTNRYGRSRNVRNFNEVLSDAIKEAYVAMFDDGGLQNAWLGKETAPDMKTGETQDPALEPVATSGPAISPEDLLTELTKLKEKDFSEDLMLAYVQQKTLTSPLTAAEMLRWKESGLPETVIQAALRLPVRR